MSTSNDASPFTADGASATSPAVVDPRVGTLISDKYEIVRVLGVGGMGKVYEGRHKRIGRRVAIKFLLADLASNSEILRRFENEARAAGSLEHENIATVYDFGQTQDGARYLVMEYLIGEDCSDLLEREGPLPVTRAVDILLQVCRGLHVAHAAGIVHRDLKPANLYLTRRGDRTELVKVLDFGIAKLRVEGGGSATVTGMAMGTAHYMSPEQARGDKSLDHRTDVYALGVILYELLTGKKPHVGESYLQIIYSILNSRPTPLAALRTGLPQGLSAVVERAMHPEASSRFASVAQLGEALIPFASGQVAPIDSGQRPPAVMTGHEETMASVPDLPPRGGASTTAPVTPRTYVPVSGGSSRRKAGLWGGVVGAAAVLAIGTAAVFLRARSIDSAEPGAAGIVSPVLPPSAPEAPESAARMAAAAAPPGSIDPAPSASGSASPGTSQPDAGVGQATGGAARSREHIGSIAAEPGPTARAPATPSTPTGAEPAAATTKAPPTSTLTDFGGRE